MINGDKVENLIDKIIYFKQCLKNHREGLNYYTKILKPNLSISNLDTFNRSPSRLLCNAFWNSLNYKNLEFQLKSKLNFFDIGCGSGEYGNFFKKISKDSFGSYFGLDIYKHNKFPSHFKHKLDNAENSYRHISDQVNFIISQSALEHIEKDITTIELITNKLQYNEKPFIQIHLVPAAKSLWLYLCHGWRQYSYKNLSSITYNLEKKFSVKCSLVPLGGNLCFWAHFKSITVPLIYNKSILKRKKWEWFKNKGSERKIINAVSKEINLNSLSPLFWGLIIVPNNIDIDLP